MSLLCSVPQCERPVRVKIRGWCGIHYGRWQRFGDPLGGGPPHVTGTPQERFLAQVEWTDDGHLLWTGSMQGKYGRFHLRGTEKVYAHRFSWEQAYGPIPEGLTLDHDPVCPKRCVNPEHLTPRTYSEHALVGWQRGEITGGWPYRAKNVQDPVTGRFVPNADRTVPVAH